MNTYTNEVAAGQRFAFGENWRNFLSVLGEERVAEARASLCAMLGVSSLEGMSFLDIGSGSGLFSLAAAQLHASRVHSFDFDPGSVGCTQELKRRFLPDSESWTIERGSALDRSYLESLGTFDIVYAWGVLHHTGNMMRALENAALPVTPGGSLFISIYNDQGLRSRMWRTIKRTYNRLPEVMRTPYVGLVMAPREFMSAALAVARLQPAYYLRTWTEYKSQRGMSRWHDLVDWVGGYPFEVATPELVFDFYRERGFSLIQLKTCGGGLGCNQFVVVKSTTSS
jgi:2-polyprenyl-6-hydroxyphenyl methylase/3-demethylubiquinone-9 3-methyltransferase